MPRGPWPYLGHIGLDMKPLQPIMGLIHPLNYEKNMLTAYVQGEMIWG